MKRKELMLMVIPMTLVLLSSCGPNKYETTEPRSVLAYINDGDSFPKVHDDVWKKIEEETNVTLTVSGKGVDKSYYDSLNTKINNPNKDTPDIFFTVPSNKDAAAYPDWVRKGYVWDIDELLLNKPGQYPNIERIIHSNQFKNIMYGDNMHTLVPYLTSRNGWAIYYRGDWLKKGGFVNPDGSPKTPTTIKEFENVLEYFTNGDPDGNGKKDTFGLAPAAPHYFWNPLYHAFGVTPDYDIDDNENVTYMYTTPEFKEYLSWAHKIYEKGYVSSSFTSNQVNEGDRKFFYDGRAGILITNGEEHVSFILSESAKQNHKDIVIGQAPVGTGEPGYGKANVGGFSDWGGYWGGYSIFKRRTGPNTFDYDKAYACLDLLEYLYSEEGGLTRMYGIQGQHWDYDANHNIVPNNENRLDYAYDIFYIVDNKAKGTYKMGSRWGTRVHWEGDNFYPVIDDTNVEDKYKTTFNETIEKNTLVSSKLVNFTGYVTGYTTKINKFETDMNQLANDIVTGTKRLENFDSEITALENGSWGEIKQVIKQAAKKAGII